MKKLASILALAALAAAPLAAQEPPKRPQTGNEDILVSGTTERERNRQIRDYARALTDADTTSAIALYQPEDYCPAVVGLSPKVNAAIAARMRQVAAAANVGVAKDPCLTSALVLFVDDADAARAALEARQPEYFTGITGEEITFHGKGTPVIAWKILARLDREGNPVAVDSTGIQQIESTMGGSRLEASSTLVVAMSVLLVEKQALRGLSTQQIADYALMRSISEVEPARLAKQRAETILTVLDTKIGEETPLSLTAWDLAYVQARYSVNRLNFGMRQLSDIRTKMRRGLEAAAAEPEGAADRQ